MSDVAQRLKIVHLRLIDAIATHRQLSRAADVVAITQPAASRMLGEIEAIVEARLFERRSRGMEPTVIGQAVARRARILILELQDVSREIEELRSGATGQVSIGAVTGPAVGYLVQAIRQLRATAHGVTVNVEVAPSAGLIAKLLEREFDFVLARVPAGFDQRQFVTWATRPEIVDFVVRRDHPLAGRGPVEAGALAEFGWVIQAEGTPIRETLHGAFLQRGLRLPDEVINTTSLLMAVAALADGSWVAPMAEEVAALLTGPEINADLVRLEVAPRIVVAPYSLLTLHGRRPSPVAERMRDIVIELLMAGQG